MISSSYLVNHDECSDNCVADPALLRPIRLLLTCFAGSQSRSNKSRIEHRTNKDNAATSRTRHGMLCRRDGRRVLQGAPQARLEGVCDGPQDVLHGRARDSRMRCKCSDTDVSSILEIQSDRDMRLT